MVTAVTSFGRSGLSDWLLQRVSGVILLAYALCLGGTLVIGVDYAQWQAHVCKYRACASSALLAILSLAAHAWIGMWAVGTDYLTERMLGTNGNLLRLACQIGCSLADLCLCDLGNPDPLGLEHYVRNSYSFFRRRYRRRRRRWYARSLATCPVWLQDGGNLQGFSHALSHRFRPGWHHLCHCQC